MALLCVMAITPWIWIYQQYGGTTNIPNYNLTMWDFMLDYIILFCIIFLGVIILLFKQSTKFTLPESKPTKQRKTKTTSTQKTSNKENKENKEKKKKLKTKDETKEKELEEWRKLYRESKKLK